MQTIEFVGELTVVRCWCGIQHAIPSGLRSHQMREQDAGRSYTVFCPLGHGYSLIEESTAAKLRRELQAEKDSLALSRAAHDHANYAHE